MNNHLDNLNDVILSICLLSNKDREWILKNLTDQQQQKLRQKLADVNTGSVSGTSQFPDRLMHRSQNGEELRALLTKSLALNRDRLLVLLNNESSWVRIYLLGRFPQLLKAALKDSAMKNRWSNTAGMESVLNAHMTNTAIQAIHDALIAKLRDILHMNDRVPSKTFNDYMGGSPATGS